MASNPGQYLPFIEEVARGAGVILMRHFRKLDQYVKKGVVDLQTIADRESEAYVVARIREAYPDHAILAEEEGRILNEGSDYLWIIDPLDGTTNYAHGLRMFAVSIALVHNKRPLAGAVFAPALDEMFLAARGTGATLNGNKINVSATRELVDALLVTGFPYDRAAYMDEISGMHRAALEDSRGVLRLGAAALDFANVAAGFLDGFYEFGLRPWDMAAGVLLVEEAGGQVAGMLKGEEMDLFKPRCVCSNGIIQEALLATLERGGAGALP